MYALGYARRHWTAGKLRPRRVWIAAAAHITDRRKRKSRIHSFQSSPSATWRTTPCLLSHRVPHLSRQRMMG